MRDSCDSLFDDWSIVEDFRDVVRSGADEFYAAVVRLLVRLGTNERRQKRVVNIDDLLQVVANEIRREDLHVSSQDDEVDFAFAEELDFLFFGFGFVFFGDRNHFVLDAIEIGVAFRVGMVADDERNVAREFAVALAVEQVNQAVVILGNKNGDARPMAAFYDAPLHAEPDGDWCKCFCEIRDVDLKTIETPLDAREIKTLSARDVLFEMENVAVALIQELRNGCVQSFLIRTLDQKHTAVLHRIAPSLRLIKHHALAFYPTHGW